MLNLMSNAVKFNEPGGQVIVSTAMNEFGQAVIRVRDTGIGMSEAEIGMALEPFRRVSTSRPRLVTSFRVCSSIGPTGTSIRSPPSRDCTRQPQIIHRRITLPKLRSNILLQKSLLLTPSIQTMLPLSKSM